MVLVVTVVLALVVVGVATYTSAALRHGQVVEQSADRLATVDGATDNALEALSRNTSLCALSALSSQPGGYTYQLGDQINGIDPTINCTAVGGGVKAIDAYAVIMTGAGGQTGPLLTIANGGSSAQAQKTFEGPVYLARTPNSSSTSFSANLTIKNGDLWYTGACPDDPTLAVDPHLSITPAGYGTQCVSHDWQTLFGSLRPPEFDVDTLTTSGTSTPTEDHSDAMSGNRGATRLPRHSRIRRTTTSSPATTTSRTSGTGRSATRSVLFGHPGATGQSIPGYKNSDTFSTNPCNAAWQADSPTGASLYMGGNSSITLGNNSALEISGAEQGAYRIAIQTLESNWVAELADRRPTDSAVRTGNEQTALGAGPRVGSIHRIRVRSDRQRRGRSTHRWRRRVGTGRRGISPGEQLPHHGRHPTVDEQLRFHGDGAELRNHDRPHRVDLSDGRVLRVDEPPR